MLELIRKFLQLPPSWLVTGLWLLDLWAWGWTSRTQRLGQPHVGGRADSGLRGHWGESWGCPGLSFPGWNVSCKARLSDLPTLPQPPGSPRPRPTHDPKSCQVIASRKLCAEGGGGDEPLKTHTNTQGDAQSHTAASPDIHIQRHGQAYKFTIPLKGTFRHTSKPSRKITHHTHNHTGIQRYQENRPSHKRHLQTPRLHKEHTGDLHNHT